MPVEVFFLFFSSLQSFLLLVPNSFRWPSESRPKTKNPPARSCSGGGSESYSIRVGLLDLQPPCARRHTHPACAAATDLRGLLSVKFHAKVFRGMFRNCQALFQADI